MCMIGSIIEHMWVLLYEMYFFQFSGRLWKAEHEDVVYTILHGKYLRDAFCRSISMNSQVTSGRLNTFYIILYNCISNE